MTLVRRIAGVALAALLAACASSSPESEPARIVRLDGTTIVPAELTARIEELT